MHKSSLSLVYELIEHNQRLCFFSLRIYESDIWLLRYTWLLASTTREHCRVELVTLKVLITHTFTIIVMPKRQESTSQVTHYSGYSVKSCHKNQKLKEQKHRGSILLASRAAVWPLSPCSWLESTSGDLHNIFLRVMTANPLLSSNSSLTNSNGTVGKQTESKNALIKTMNCPVQIDWYQVLFLFSWDCKLLNYFQNSCFFKTLFYVLLTIQGIATNLRFSSKACWVLLVKESHCTGYPTLSKEPN